MANWQSIPSQVDGHENQSEYNLSSIVMIKAFVKITGWKRGESYSRLFRYSTLVWLVLLASCQQKPPVSVQEATQAPASDSPANRFAFSIDHPVSDCGGREDLDAGSLVVRSEDPTVKIQVEGAKLAECPRPAQSRTVMSVALAMDHSWSLYDRVPVVGSYEKFDARHHSSYYKQPGTDPDGKRFEAALGFLSKLPPDAHVLLAYFAADNQDYEILSAFSAGIAQAKSALAELSPRASSDRGTPLWNTLMGLLDELEKEPTHRRRCLICFTDGDNMLLPGLPTYEAPDVIEKAQRFKIPIFFVLLGSQETLSNFEEVKRKVENIAQSTGGQSVPVAEASGLQQAFERITDAVNVIPCYRLKCFAERPSGYMLFDIHKLLGLMRGGG
jgi:hypothetical protein